MDDLREKVIKRLNEEITHNEYWDEEYADCVPVSLLKDALSLLKAQEPRLLMAEEVKKVPEGKIVWVEQHTREKDYLMPMAATGDGRFGNFYLGILWKEVNTRFYRMWASKPTDEQRKATPWDTKDG